MSAKFHSTKIYYYTDALLLCEVILAPLFGYISDRIGRIKLLFFTIIFSAFSIIPITILMQKGYLFTYVIFMLANVSVFPVLQLFIAELVDTKNRYSSFAIVFNIAFIIGGNLPLLCGVLFKNTGEMLFVALFIISLYIIIFLTLLSIKRVKEPAFTQLSNEP
jgi:MFS family permease